MRYYLIFIVLIAGLFGCGTNSRPEQAAKEYCVCLQQQYDYNVDTPNAFYNCDSIVAIHYGELYTYYRDKNANSVEWDSASKFHSKLVELRLRNCCTLIGNCDTAKHN
jgi:hypothetical protein